MLTINGRGGRLCDGVTRRDALKIGALGLGGLSLPDLLRAEQRAGIKGSHKAVIMIYMCGAPPHQDMYDLKMKAPSGIRGPFQPIDTAVPGIQICEHMPMLAKVMDKCIPLRSVHGSPNGSHDSFICYTGHSFVNQPPGDWPSMGAVASRLQGPVNVSVPPFIGLSPNTGHPPYGSPGHPGFLGISHGAFRPSGPSRANMKLNGVTLDRLGNRKQLLTSLDAFRRSHSGDSSLAGLDDLNRQALDILTSSRLADALDLSKEDPAVRERYGKGSPKNFGDGAPRNLEHFLMARRLVEAGARVVTLNFGRWDFHSNNHNTARDTHLPMFDRGLATLIADIYERGLGDDVSVVAWGEFGRTPRINKTAGRDHWPQVGGGLIAGGGMQTGQVIGSTDRLGGVPKDRPVHFGEVFATLYRNLGLDPASMKLPDLSGRPQFIVDKHSPMPEV
ncbi:MAG TPA: DUF1501 domain-containing protein [Planctomycetaceae bacterium]|jgi:hypothetical protein|nr:DUF1501 domain-containing protein [Planctomycetales bacterium]HAA59896.1 DUF1501 domain-containing protein [Planctomycetaceae bacterium]